MQSTQIYVYAVVIQGEFNTCRQAWHLQDVSKDSILQ